jgi:hypothetical protein
LLNVKETVTYNHQIHVIAKLLQLENVEINLPVDQLLVETTKFKFANLNLNAKLLQEDVEAIVMIMLNVPLILVILEPQNVFTLMTITNVTMETHVQLIDVLLKDVHTPKRIALTTMHVPETFVILPMETVFLHLLLANLPIVKLQHVIQLPDVKQLIETVMMVLHVLLMFAVKIVDVTILLMINLVMIMIHAPLTNVLSRKDVFTKRFLVTITTHAPTMFAYKENANLFMLANKATNAQYLHVMQ